MVRVPAYYSPEDRATDVDWAQPGNVVANVNSPSCAFVKWEVDLWLTHLNPMGSGVSGHPFLECHTVQRVTLRYQYQIP